MKDVKIKDLNRNHEAVRAGIAMVKAHKKHKTMVPAIDELRLEFPSIEYGCLILLWIGVNAKSQDPINHENTHKKRTEDEHA